MMTSFRGVTADRMMILKYARLGSVVKDLTLTHARLGFDERCQETGSKDLEFLWDSMQKPLPTQPALYTAVREMSPMLGSLKVASSRKRHTESDAQ